MNSGDMSDDTRLVMSASYSWMVVCISVDSSMSDVRVLVGGWVDVCVCGWGDVAKSCTGKCVEKSVEMVANLESRHVLEVPFIRGSDQSFFYVTSPTSPSSFPHIPSWQRVTGEGIEQCSTEGEQPTINQTSTADNTVSRDSSSKARNEHFCRLLCILTYSS